jgi:hypothetical protein
MVSERWVLNTQFWRKLWLILCLYSSIYLMGLRKTMISLSQVAWYADILYSKQFKDLIMFFFYGLNMNKKTCCIETMYLNTFLFRCASVPGSCTCDGYHCFADVQYVCYPCYMHSPRQWHASCFATVSLSKPYNHNQTESKAYLLPGIIELDLSLYMM